MKAKGLKGEAAVLPTRCLMEQLSEKILHITEPFYRYRDNADDDGKFFEGVHNVTTPAIDGCYMV